MTIYDYLKKHKEEVIFVDKTGLIVSVYCKNNVKIIFECRDKRKAQKEYTKFRRELEDVRLGE